MKNFQTAYHTDIGIKKQTNQDSILLNGAEVGEEEILLAVLCEAELKNVSKIKSQWEELISDCNEKLIIHGKMAGIQLGTTVTAIMIWSDSSYLIGHIGDTRIYHISNQLHQLTEDHTYVAREIKRGNMTKEQAAKDNRRNVLLQCVGGNEMFEPQFCEGCIECGEAFLVCSDGFRHEISEDELLRTLNPSYLQEEAEIKQKLRELVDLNKQRGEADNISAIYIKKV